MYLLFYNYPPRMCVIRLDHGRIIYWEALLDNMLVFVTAMSECDTHMHDMTLAQPPIWILSDQKTPARQTRVAEASRA